MTVPSVKGAMLLSSVVVVRRARDRGEIPESRLAKLSARTQELLDERIQLAQWYPMENFAELLEIDWEIGGNLDPEYMRRSGRQNALSMTKGARYQQFEYLKRASRPKSGDEVVSQMRLTTSVTLSYFNFIEIKVQIDPRHPNVLQIIYVNTDPFPEALRYSTEGFMDQLNQVRGSSKSWTSDRVGNRIVFSLELKARSEADRA